MDYWHKRYTCPYFTSSEKRRGDGRRGIPLYESILCRGVGALHHRTAPDGRVRKAGRKEWGVGVSPKE